MNKKEVIVVATLLALGFLIRISISNNSGFVADVLAHKEWAQSLYEHGLLSAY